MSEYTRIKLTNMTPMHIGEGKDYYDSSSHFLQSDTLSAALASIRAESGNDKDIEDFLQSFALSSAFPYYGNHYFLPKLHGRLNVEVQEKTEEEVRKQLKKIKYVEDVLWFKLASSIDKVKIDKDQIQGDFLLGSVDKNFEKPITSNVTQRVKVPRDGNHDSEPFYFEWNYFCKDGGMYCLLQANEQRTKDVIDLFEKLGMSGIGSDRNVGGGSFEVVAETIQVESLSSSNATALLSMYIPADDEIETIDLNNAQYELILRGGFVAGSSVSEFRHLRKKSVYMFGPGSIFLTTASLQGKVVDLAPSWQDKRMHPVYRSGKPLCINIKR